jgi:hypothetical protein
VPELNGRWVTTDERADRYAESATADHCGSKIDDFAAAWGALEGFQYDLYAFDPGRTCAGPRPTDATTWASATGCHPA